MILTSLRLFSNFKVKTMKKSYKMLTLGKVDIKKLFPAIASWSNFEPDFIGFLFKPIHEWMTKEGYVMDKEETPEFDRLRSLFAKHEFIFHNPEVRVWCKKYNNRYIITEIWVEFRHIV